MTPTPQVPGKIIPRDVLEQFLVPTGGKGWLITNKNFPNDDGFDAHIVMTLDLSPSGNSFGGFRALWLGEPLTIDVKESGIFTDGDENITLSWGVSPRDIDFQHNTWYSKWLDGNELIRRSDISVDPATGRDNFSKDDRQFCFRYIISVQQMTQPKVSIQVLPSKLSALEMSPWGDSDKAGGIEVWSFAERVGWNPTLDATYDHQGPAPFLVDLRSADTKSVFPSSQMYRDSVLDAVLLATKPRVLSVDQAKNYSPTGLDLPTHGVFRRIVEYPTEVQKNSRDGNQPPFKRVRINEVPQFQSSSTTGEFYNLLPVEGNSSLSAV